MYRDWDPSGQPWEHGSNIRIEIDRPANRTRAEGCLYVWEIALPCREPSARLRVKATVQKGRPCHPGAAKVGPNSLKFQMGEKAARRGEKGPKVTRNRTPRGRIWSMEAKVRPQFTYSFRIDELGPRFGGEGPRAEGSPP